MKNKKIKIENCNETKNSFFNQLTIEQLIKFIDINELKSDQILYIISNIVNNKITTFDKIEFILEFISLLDNIYLDKIKLISNTRYNNTNIKEIILNNILIEWNLIKKYIIEICQIMNNLFWIKIKKDNLKWILKYLNSNENDIVKEINNINLEEYNWNSFIFNTLNNLYKIYGEFKKWKNFVKFYNISTIIDLENTINWIKNEYKKCN